MKRTLIHTVLLVSALSASRGAELSETTLASAQAETGKTATVITSDRLTFDYRARVGVFEGHVLVADPSLKIEADKLTIAFDADDKPKVIIAIGQVRLREGDRLATSERAAYDVVSGELVLTGDPRVMRGQDVLMGQKITLRRNEEKIVCEPGYLKILPREGDRQTVIPFKRQE